jgi:hypothetical protein
MRRRRDRALIRALRAAPDPTPAQELAATGRLLADIKKAPTDAAAEASPNR